MINEYIARKVAVKDTQSCLICSMPCTTVLYNNSGPDWFYTCDIHLQDNPHFVVPIYSQEYQDALNKLKILKAKVGDLTNLQGSASWDGWVSKIFTRKTKETEDAKNDKDGTKEKELDTKTANAADTADTAKKNVQREYSEQLDLVTELQKKNKKYQLSKITFDSRVQRKLDEQKLKAKRKIEEENYTNTDPDDLVQKFCFPVVPKGATSKESK